MNNPLLMNLVLTKKIFQSALNKNRSNFLFFDLPTTLLAVYTHRLYQRNLQTSAQAQGDGYIHQTRERERDQQVKKKNSKSAGTLGVPPPHFETIMCVRTGVGE